MGSAYSNARKHCLVEFPHVTTRKCDNVISVRLQLMYSDDGEHCWFAPERCYPYDAEKETTYVFGALARRLAAKEQALIMGVFLLVAQNELDIGVEFTLRHLFPVQKNLETMSAHPDYTGKIKLMVPRNQRGLVPGDNQMQYEFNSENEITLKYAGLEQRILHQHSVPFSVQKEEESDEEPKGKEEEDDYELFTDEDELIEFLLQNRDLFKPSAKEMYQVSFEEGQKSNDKTYYHLQKDFLQKVRTYFRTDIFSKLHYTRFVDQQLDLHLSEEMQKKILSLHPKNERQPAPSVSFVLQVNYLVVSEGSVKTEAKPIKRHY